jgi:ABC-type branched-subunit amino acid transport system permease subunit
MLYTTIVVAWQLIGGLGGQLDLGAGAYHGLGAIVTGYLMCITVSRDGPVFL